MTQTSLTAWQHVKRSLSQRQAAVLDALRRLGGKGTMHVVANFLEVHVHTISGRFSELRKKGLIRRWDVVKPEKGQPRIIWEVV